MKANSILLQKKYARVIVCYAKKYNVDLEIALRVFYKSLTYTLVSEGVSDLHCMSDDYLAEELHDEVLENPDLFSD